MRIFIDGETKEVQAETSLSQLLKQLALPEQRIAIELNKEVVRRKDWNAIQVKEADKIEIVHFVGGG